MLRKRPLATVARPPRPRREPKSSQATRRLPQLKHAINRGEAARLPSIGAKSAIRRLVATKISRPVGDAVLTRLCIKLIWRLRRTPNWPYSHVRRGCNKLVYSAQASDRIDATVSLPEGLFFGRSE